MGGGGREGWAGFLLSICLFRGHKIVSVHTKPLSSSVCHCGTDEKGPDG